MKNWKEFLKFKGNNDGITLINVIIMVIIIFIIASIAITGGLAILNNSKDSNKDENLAAVKAAVNKISLQKGMSGVFTAANSEVYGKPAKDAFSNEEYVYDDWYILGEEDLEKMGVTHANTTYIVNYKQNKVYSIDEFNEYAKEFENTIPENYSGERKVYTVNFHPDDESVSGNMTSQKFLYGVPQKLKGNTYTKNGYYFLAWNTKPDGSGTTYSNRQVVSDLTEEDNGVVDLYTIWGHEAYKIRFNANGGNGVMADQELRANANDTLNECTFVMLGHHCASWNTKADGTGTSYENRATIENIDIGNNGLILYAQWAPNDYTIKFNSNKGEGTMSNQVFTYNEPQNLNKNIFTRRGYEFSKWNTKADGTGTAYEDKATINNIISNGEITLYAQWTAVKYTVIFDPNDGQGAMTDVDFMFDTVNVLPANTFTRIGYTFDCWNTSADGTGDNYADRESVINIAKSGTITLYAKWAPITYNIIYKEIGGTSFDGTHADNHPTTHTYATETELKGASKPGYVLEGWYLNSDGTGIATTILGATDYTSDITLYAKWKNATYTITYKDVGKNSFTGTHADNYPTTHTYGTKTILKSASKSYYMFGGWYTNSNGSGSEVTSLGATAYTDNITLYAKWVPMTYTITYKDAGDVAFSGTHAQNYPTIHSYGTITTLKGASKVGYTFDGWHENREGTGTSLTSLGATTYTENITLYAKWTPNRYTITYKDVGGDDFSGTHEDNYPTTHTYGKSTELKGASKEGNTFSGWFANSEGTGEAVTSIGATESTTNITLYAKWIPAEYTITYKDVGGDDFSGTHEDNYPTTHKYGIPTILKRASKVGYTFNGWYEYSDGTGKEVTSIGATECKADITLYAKWTPITYSIIYKDVGNENFSGTHEYGYVVTHTYGTVTVLKGASKVGYTFNGWYRNSEGTGEAVTSLGATEYTGNISLYAKWTPVTYSITYKDVGNKNFSGTHADNYPTTHTYGVATELKGASKVGYTFNGWYRNSEGTGEAVTSLGATEYTVNITLYARWTPITYSIIYKDVGDEDFSGTHESDYPTTHTYGVETTLKGASKVGHTFNGWYVNSEGTGEAVTSLGATEYTANITLYAKWTPITYSITYKDVGGDDFSGTHADNYPTTHTYGVTTILKGASKVGYTFNGWYANSEGTDEAVTSLGATEYTANITLYAKWTPIAYAIIYKDVGDEDFSGTHVDNYPATHVYGTVTILKEASKVGYTFNGWFANSEGTGEAVTSLGATEYTANITLYAKWTPITYSIIYKDVGDEDFSGTHADNYPTTHTYGVATTLKGASKVGYTFNGWYINSEGTGEAVTSLGATEYTANITLYAKWTPITYSITYKDEGDKNFSGTHESDYPTTHTYGVATELKGASKIGYTFNGWYRNSEGTGEVVTSLGATDYTADITLYAKWTAITYSIIYKDVGDEDFSGTHADNYPTTHTYGVATELKEASKVGYTFNGWFANSEGTGEAVTSLGATEYTANITLYAKWIPITYSITYKDVGNENFSGTHESDYPTTHTYGVATTLKGASKVGHTFNGWYVNSEGTGEAVTSLSETEYTENITLYAKWTPIAYAITYKDIGDEDFSGGHESDYPTTHTYGVTTILKGASKEGYIFDGWFANSEGTGEVVTSLGATDYTSDITLYAEWTPATYTITYKDVGGDDFSGTHADNYPTTHTYGVATELKGASKVGYIFEGWYVNSEGTGESLTNLGAADYTSDITLYAKWTPIEYAITYKDVGNEDFSGTHESDYPTTHTYGVETTLKGASKEGYTFNGWYINSEGTGEAVTSLGATAYTSNITLYAKWTPITYSITYKDVGDEEFSGTHESNYPTTHTYGVATTLKGASKEGYTFEGWYRNSEGTGEAVTNLGATEYTENITLYAKWTPIEYAITYKDVSGDEFSGTHESDYPTTHTYGVATELKGASKIGYTFNGWYVNSEGTGEAVTSLGATAYTSNITLYAKWTPITYSITYKDVGNEDFSGTHESDYPTTHTYGVATTLKGASKVGYTFNGWYRNSEGTGEAVTSLGATEYTANITLYAKWTPITYSIIYKDVGDENFSGTHADNYPITHTYGVATTLKGASKASYTFEGWYTNSEGTGEAVTSLGATAYTSNITLYAKWTLRAYTITYKDVGNENFSGTHESNYPTTHTYGVATTLKGASKVGYTFNGWYGNSEGTGEVVTSLGATDYTADITLYAKWTPITYSITYKDVGDVDFSGTHESDYPTTHTYGVATTLKGANKANYAFEGWYANSEGTGEAVTSLGATAYTSNITLYAKWTILAYTITYKDVGGDDFSGTHESDYPTTHTYGVVTTLKGANKANYVFEGWHLNSNGTDSAITSLGATDYTADITLYAKWTLQDYTISYTLNGGTVSGTNPTSYNINTATITLINPTKIGYTFKGWSGTDLTGDTNTSVTIPTGSSGNRSYTANWTPYTYTVVFNNDLSTKTQSFTYGISQKLSKNTFDKTGYSFSVWTTEADGTGTSYVDEQNVLNLTAVDGGIVNLYAQWIDDTEPTLTKDLRSARYSDFSDWTLSGGAYIDGEGSLIIPSSTAVAYNYFESHNTQWDTNYEIKTTDGFGAESFDYFTENYEEIAKQPGWKSERSSKSDSSGVWTYSNKESQPATAAYYTRVKFYWSDSLTEAQYAIRNFKFLTNEDVSSQGKIVYLSASDSGSGVKQIKYLSGTKTASDFINEGIVVTDRIEITENGVYTICVEDNAGNKHIETINITTIDRTAPTASITSTNNVAPTQTATLSVGNDATKYYFGKQNLQTTFVQWQSITETTMTKTIDSEGTWYLGVKDYAGNVAVVNEEFYKTVLIPNRGTITPTTILTMGGNTFTIPTPTSITGFTFNGWYKNEELTISAGTSHTPDADISLYGKWTTNEYIITLNNQSATSEGTSTIYETYGTKFSLTSGGNEMTTSANGINVPTRTGYAFGGYYTDRNGEGTQVIDANGFITSEANTTLFSEDGVLYAKWTDATNPIITITKETSQDGFEDWELSGGANIDSYGTLNLPESTSTAKSRYYSAEEPWYVTYDAHTTAEVPGTSLGGSYFNSKYYNAGLTNINNNAGAASNDWNKAFELSEWNNLNYSDDIAGNSNVYGGNIKYITLEFKENDSFSKNPIRIKNLKVHGQLWSSFYDIIANAVDNESGIETIKYDLGNKDINYFATNGITIADGETIRVTENGTYTVYAEDNAGNKTIQTIVINQIDKTAPTNTAPSYTKTANSITVTNGQVDNESGIFKVEYAIKESGGEYDDWQSSNVFTGLKSSTTYSIKTRSINHANLKTESLEETVTTDTIEYTITLNNQGATAPGTATIYEIYENRYSLTSGGAAMTANANPITKPEKTGSLFTGYYTEQNGNGVQIIDANGYITAEASNTLFESNSTIYACWSTGMWMVTFDACGGISSEPTRAVSYDAAVGTLPTASYVNHMFDEWYTLPTGGTKVTASTVVTKNVTYYAHWKDAIAEIDGRYFETLAAAVSSVTTSEETTIKLVNNSRELINIPSGKNIIFDFGTNTLSNNAADKPIIENRGNLKFVRGTISCNSTQGAVNVYSGATFVVTGGSIIATGTKQAVYNNGGRVEIHGGYFSAEAKVENSNKRATVHNYSGTMIITGGTIVSPKSVATQGHATGIAITNRVATLTIGTKDGQIDRNVPEIIGEVNGINNDASFNFYDGVIKGKTSAVTSPTKIGNMEPGYGIALVRPQDTPYEYTVFVAAHTVTFNPNGGKLENDDLKKRTVQEGQPIGTLPVPTKAGYVFTGWFDALTGGQEVTEATIVGNDDVTYYAHWMKAPPAEVNGKTYGTIQEAINTEASGAVINIVENATEHIEIKNGKEITLNLNGHTISNNGSDGIIENNGILTITSGTMNSRVATKSAINNNPGCTLIVDGVSIIATGVDGSTENRQTIYNKGGTVIIRGDTYLESKASGKVGTPAIPRGTVHNLEGGTMTIEGGTIVNKNAEVPDTANPAVSNDSTSTLIIGTKDGLYDEETPTIIGKKYGIYNAGTVKYYDGTINGMLGAVSGTTFAEIETYHSLENGTKEIQLNDETLSYTYYSASLSAPITITPSTLSPTAAPITANIAYDSSIVSGMKAGFGTSLSEAIINASTSTANSVSITGKGYVYAEGYNSNNDPITVYLHITNITN